MVISEELMQKSRNRAESILKSSIVKLAISLSVDLDDLDSGYVVPVAEDDVHHRAHLCLKRMCESLERLQSS